MPTLVHHHEASKTWPPFKLPFPLIRRPSMLMKLRFKDAGTDVCTAEPEAAPLNRQADRTTAIDENPFAWFLTPPNTPPAFASDSDSLSSSSLDDQDDEDDDEDAFIFEDNSPAGITPSAAPGTKASALPRPKLLSQPPRSRSLSPLRQLLVHRWLHSHQHHSDQEPDRPPPASPVLRPTPYSTSPTSSRASREWERPRGRDTHSPRHTKPSRPDLDLSSSGRRASSLSPRPRTRPHAWRKPSSELWTVLEEDARASTRSHTDMDPESYPAFAAPLLPHSANEGGDAVRQRGRAQNEDEIESSGDEDDDVEEEMSLDF